MVSAHDDGDTRSEMGKLLRLGAARGGGEREAMEQASAFGQALAFFWSSDARRGDLGSACTPRGNPLLSRSAMATLTVF